jgi:hypothetical protein
MTSDIRPVASSADVAGRNDIFFHVGLHKTATSWFQEVLFPNLAGIDVLKPEDLRQIELRLKTPSPLIVTWEALSGSLSPRKTPGSNCECLQKSLNFIRELAPKAGIIIGFREHRSWLQAAAAQKAKYKWYVDKRTYVETFSPADLSWCSKLETISRSFVSVFPFLYEEIIRRPTELIGDLCAFVGKEPPGNLQRLLVERRNPSPRSDIGQFVSRSLCMISPRHKEWTRRSHRIGAYLDHFAPASEVVIDPELAKTLRQDWVDLVHRVSDRRRKDLLHIANLTAPVPVSAG